MNARNILLSTPWGPYEPDMYYGIQTDVMSQRFSRGCDIFTLSGHMHLNFAHVIAQNTKPPTVFLEYPRRDDFVEELRRGYDIVGIGSLHNQVESVIEMCRVVRKVSPQSTVVLGGYGAVGIEAVYPESEWRTFADHICHEEGITFMRRLLEEPTDAPISVTHLPRCSLTLPWLNKHACGNVGVIAASLGCPKGCDFCGTTEMYSRKRIELLSPKQVVDEMKRYYREHPQLLTVIILEEDSFAQKDYLSEIGRLIREDTEIGGLGVMSYFMLGGIESLSEWSYDDLLLTGMLAAFIGVESKFAPEHGYKKRRGNDLAEVFLFHTARDKPRSQSPERPRQRLEFVELPKRGAELLGLLLRKGGAHDLPELLPAPEVTHQVVVVVLCLKVPAPSVAVFRAEFAHRSGPFRRLSDCF